MKNILLPVIFLFFSSLVYCQEVGSNTLPSSAGKDFIIELPHSNPALSNLGPEVPMSGRFKLTEVNFNKETPREVDIAKLAKEDELEQKSRMITLDSPIHLKTEHKTFAFSARPNEEYSFYNHAFIPKTPSNTTPNSVYEDAGIKTGSYYLSTFSPFYRRYSY